MVSGDKTSGTSTDIHGNYAINVTGSGSELEYSCMGYVTVNEKINGRNVINVSLSEDNELLDEVVVVGYGVQKRLTSQDPSHQSTSLRRARAASSSAPRPLWPASPPV